jgi:capsular polysaccharide biosynthesis protein
MPLLVDAGMPRQHVEAVRFFVGDGQAVIEVLDRESVRVDRLWVASALAYLPVGPLPEAAAWQRPVPLSRDGFATLLERIAPALESIDTSGAPSRLYLGRKPSQHRRLAHGDEIERLVVEAGFEIVDFGDLSFREQVRLVRGAEWIIGPSGSSLLATVFGRPGLRVGALVPLGPTDVAWLAQAYAVIGIDLMTIVGEIVTPHPRYRWMSDYAIDPSVLSAYLADPG